jgi:hypothetical protein
MKYTKWHKPRGGVKKEDGTGRLCMNCRKAAVHTATLVSNRHTMGVWLCEEHKTQAENMDERKR